MKRIFSSAVVAGGLLASGQSMAEGLLQWQSNSLSYLNGRDFTVNPSNQQTFTFEHADGWKYGDNFVFIDKIFYNGKGDATNGDNTYYGEISPRLSMGKIFGKKIEFGPISDVLIAATYEFGEGDNESYLIGPAVDLKIPGFDYFQLNFYKRYTDGHRAGYGAWQITPVWSYTIPVGKSDILIDGFIDWVVDNKSDSNGEYKSNVHINPQIKYDLGKAINLPDRQLYVGIEYDYWSDKYGIEDTKFFDTNQNTASLLVKVFF